jgi:hypothetical protein
MADTLTENLINDVATAVQVKLAALDNSLTGHEKTALDIGALAAQAKNAITSPEMGNILRRANQRGLHSGALSGILGSLRGGATGAVQGYKNAGPGAWNKIKGTMGGSLKGQATGLAKGFGGGYAGGAGGSIIADAMLGNKDMQTLKGMFGGTPATAVPAGNNAAFNALNSGNFTWGKVTGGGIQQTPRRNWN